MNHVQAAGWATPDFARLRLWFAPNVLIGLAATLVVFLDHRSSQRTFHLLAALAAAWLGAAAASLWAQAAGWKPRAGLIVQGVAGALAAALAWYDKETGLFAPALYPALVFACFAAPQRALPDADSYWGWCEEVLLAAALAGAVAAAGFIATTTTVWSADRLFGVGAWMREHVAPWSAAIFFCAVGPAAFLAILPRLGAMQATSVGDFLRRPLAILSSWALAPFVWIYSGLLWLYAGKIALARVLPDGQIGWMVGAFGVTALGTILLIVPQRASGPARVRWLWRLWPFLTVAPLVLLGFALWERLDAYGLTPARYVAVLLALLCALIAAVALTGRERIVRFAPAAAAVGFLVASFGPWGALGASTRAQADTIRVILAAHGLMRDGALVAGAKPVTLDARESRRWNAANAFLRSNDAFGRVIGDADGQADRKLAALVRTTTEKSERARGYYYTNNLVWSVAVWSPPPELASMRLLGAVSFSESGPSKQILGPATFDFTTKALSVRIGDDPPTLFEFEKIAAGFLAGKGKWPEAPVLLPTSGAGKVALIVDHISLGTGADGAPKAGNIRGFVFAAP